MTVKRLFIGTRIDSKIFANDKYNDVKIQLKNVCSGKWVETENLHFTYKFLGDVEIHKIKELQHAMNDICIQYTSELEFKGLGVFPNMKNPRVLFVNIINRDNMLKRINSDIEDICLNLGFAKEMKAFKAHLTLMRIKSVEPLVLKESLDEYSDIIFGTMNTFGVNIIESRLLPSGPIYRDL